MTNQSPSTSRSFLCRKTWGSVDDYVRSLSVLLCCSTIDGLFIINFLNRPKDFHAWIVVVIGILPITGMLCWYWWGKIQAVWADFNRASKEDVKSMVFIESLVLAYFILASSVAVLTLATLVSTTNWVALKGL